MLHVRISRGFTFIEILVVLTIISIIAALSSVAFQNMSRSVAIKVATQEVYGALTGARTDTLASKGDTVFGVHMSTSSVTRFVGNVYTEGDTNNEVYLFEGGVTATSSLIANGTDVIFSRLTGASSASGTIFIRNSDGESTTTIRIHSSGLVQN